VVRAISRYLRELHTYLRETRTPLDFLRLMQVRLSLSKLGRLVCPRPVVRRVTMRSFGGPIYLRSHTSDISVLKEQLLGDSYGAIERCAPQVRSILDLGANTGLAARWLLHRHPGARLVCVEPEPGNVRVLERNLAGTGAVIVAACVGARERRVMLTTSTGEWGYRMRDTPDGDIPVVLMDWLLGHFPGDTVDVLKCDIEGAERELFRDAPWAERVRFAAVECHGLAGEAILPDGWRIVERDANARRPGYETVAMVHGSTARRS
jgi:FkbM family methyltransferase